MKRLLNSCALMVFALVLATPVIAGDAPQADTLGDAIRNGKPEVTVRYRFEEVDQDNLDDNSHASTLRTTIGYQSAAYEGFSFRVQAEDVTVIGSNTSYFNKGFEELSNGVAGRPVVLDPRLTEINQAYFMWKNAQNKISVGRREVIIGDARFVGNVGWRQNHQSFDGLTWTNKSLDFAKLSYGFISKVNRIDGSVHNMDSHLINADIKVKGHGGLGLYGYMLDYNSMGPVGLSRATYGAEFKGKAKLNDDATLLYEVEFATQSDFGDNPNTVEATYYFVMAGVALKPVTFKVGYETLGGDASATDNKGAFVTPLATLHKFNGWADKFLGTPGAGLNDLYFQAAGKVGPVKAVGAYHIFKTDDGGDDLGKEFDIQLTMKSSWKQLFGVKAAFYTTDANTADLPASPAAHQVDTSKIWVFTGFSI